MSTLGEIEAATDALPLEQKKKLLEFLTARVNGGATKGTPTDLREFAGTVRLPEDPLVWHHFPRIFPALFVKRVGLEQDAGP